jgi:hypothetical protein
MIDRFSATCSKSSKNTAFFGIKILRKELSPDMVYYFRKKAIRVPHENTGFVAMASGVG